VKKILLALLLFSHLTLTLTETIAQAKGALKPLTAPESALIPAGFYISTILDERKGVDSIGTLLFSSNEKSVTHKISLESTTFQGIRKFFVNNVVSDTSLRPLIIRIKECKIQEVLSGRDRVLGEVSLVLSFDLEKGSESVPLTQYKSSAKYTRPLINLSSVEASLRILLKNSLSFINNWINKEEVNNPQLAKRLRLTFRDYQQQHADTVYYNSSRPLRWDDFRETRSEGNFAASIFPSFGYDQRTKLEDGIIEVELVLKVFMVKSASWVGPGSRSNYNLNHEQKHFELVKLVAERFKKKLLSEKLNPDNYQGIINFEYLEFYREMNKIQREYDAQTSHGTSGVNQAIWDKKIETEIKELKVEN